MELSFREFDLIMGMDWFVEHRFSMNCATKWVFFRSRNDVEVIVIGERQDYF